MSLQWTLVAGFLYAEILVCILLCLPFISAKRWQYLFKSRIAALFVSYGNIGFVVLISILCLLFLDAVRETRKYWLPDAQQVNLSNNPNTQDHVLMMLFRAQRNLYISGFALFLWLVLRRLVLLISGTAVLDANCQATQRQAESASRAAQELMDRSEGDGDTDTSADLNKAKKELEQLKMKLTEAKEDVKKAQADKQAMKEQATATSKEYDRLMTEMANLQNEFEDSSKKDT